jgi:hypothetical protein
MDVLTDNKSMTICCAYCKQAKARDRREPICIISWIRQARKKLFNVFCRQCPVPQKASEANKKTQNSGIMTTRTHQNNDIEFYGSLSYILDLRYNSSRRRGRDRTVVLFRIDWYWKGAVGNLRLEVMGTSQTSILEGTGTNIQDPYILSEQATKVFYLPDTLLGNTWRVV